MSYLILANRKVTLRAYVKIPCMVRRYCSKRMPWQRPDKEGMYDPSFEKEGCGVGMLVAIDGTASSKLMHLAKRLSMSMVHRGGESYDNRTGDGAGIMTAIPHKLYAATLKNEQNIQLPRAGRYATGILFLDPNQQHHVEEKFTALAEELSLSVVAWKTVLTDNEIIGGIAEKYEPLMRQVFITPYENVPVDQHDTLYYVLRKRATHTLSVPPTRFYICSLHSRVIVHKGQLTATQLWSYFPDLLNPTFETNVAIVHNRFATNTFPSWELAHPHRVIAHNGEINTLRGNLNYMRARESSMMKSPVLGEHLAKVLPVIEANTSDSGSMDNAIEFLIHASERSLPEAVMTLSPEAYRYDPTMSQEKKVFYKWSSCVMEPWDGPALIAFCDGKYVGATQDRNGLRPSRFYVTKDNLLIMASEIDMYDIEDPANIVLKSRLKPGRMLLVDLKHNTMVQDLELKKKISESRPHAQWLKEELFTLDDLRRAAKQSEEVKVPPCDVDDKRVQLFHYHTQVINMQLVEMFKNQREAVASMGSDMPMACLSRFNPLLYDYFVQVSAQVTNPPIDPIREQIVMNLECPIGPCANLLVPSAKQAHRLWLEHPILSIQDIQLLKDINYKNWSSITIDMSYAETEGPAGVKSHLVKICAEASEASEKHQFIILSDKNAGEKRVPISAVLCLGAVHHHLIDKGQRLKVGLIVETGEAKVVHDMCVLLGYGADAICPYLPLELGAGFVKAGVLDGYTDKDVFDRYKTALKAGISSVMAKMGIATLQSYKNAQTFEAVGLANDVVDKCFRGTPSRIGGMNLDMLACEIFERHRDTYMHKPDNYVRKDKGTYHYRYGGEKRMNNPASIAYLQEAAMLKNVNAYRKFRLIEMESRKHCLLRGQLELNTAEMPLPLDEVESATDLLKRFCIGGMSLGSISAECHETIATAMNKIDGRSNSGEGGEHPARYKDIRTRSRVKQVATARWGVTSAYLAHADELQIKVAQGSKPGTGEILYAEKAVDEVALLRRVPRGIELVSPPPHHDIYSIEDLKELIHELRSANPQAKISVKLVSAAGVGIIATGVTKCKADHIVISGHDGGTAGGTWTSIKSTGLPWEMGIAEAHQVLKRNHLRSRVVLQADGQIRTGFDVVVAAILGADEVALCTTPLIALGCMMTRKCHLNTCPVGIATMNPELRKFFKGKPEHLINYLYMLAHDVRFHMASMAVRSYNELIGRTDLLCKYESEDHKARSLNFSALLRPGDPPLPEVNIGSLETRRKGRLDDKLVKLAAGILEGHKKKLMVDMIISNMCRAFGSGISYHISKIFGEAGLPDDHSIQVNISGSAGQSFCAYLQKGLTVMLEGDANDYVGKGLSGGTVIIYPPKEAKFESHLNVIAGNVCLYGATSGRVFMRGIAGERFAVRNSGALAVVEGVGDHCCEYMTGGLIIVLGLTGRNFGSGMLGGVAYVWDLDKSFDLKCNKQTVDLSKLEDPKDLELLKNYLFEFQEATNSVLAEELLNDFSAKAQEFVKVTPKYKQYRYEPKKYDRRIGFMLYPRENRVLRDVSSRVKDLNEVYDFAKIYKTIRKQSARCIDCGVPFCETPQYGCPLSNTIPLWTWLVAKNRMKEAVMNLLQTDNFPEFTGRVCPAPCESACVLNLTHTGVTIRNVEVTIADVGFEKGWIRPKKPEKRTDKKVAIIGSGPSGLACGAQLNKAGHNVTIFERKEHAGGLLYYGIPNTKLDKKWVDKRLSIMQEEGIQFKTKVNVGVDLMAEELLESYDAVVMCVGATEPNDLKVPGRKLSEIYFATDFLQQCGKSSEKTPEICAKVKGKNIVVIGAGASAIDCISTIVRYEAASITAVDVQDKPPKHRKPSNPWPQSPRTFDLQPAHQSALYRYGTDARVFGLQTLAFLDGGNGKVAGIRTAKVEWYEENGQVEMKRVKGSEKVIKADMVLIAVGFVGPERYLGDALKMEYDTYSNFRTSRYRTNVKKVFATGDCRTGESIVVKAIADGRQAARVVDEYLTGKPSLLPGPGGIVPKTLSDRCEQYTRET